MVRVEQLERVVVFLLVFLVLLQSECNQAYCVQPPIQNNKKKEEGKKNLLETVCPKILQQLEDIVSETEGSYIAGDKLTYGDLFTVNWLQIWENQVSADLLNDYPALRKLKDAVLAIPEISAWIEERPKTSI